MFPGRPLFSGIVVLNSGVGKGGGRVPGTCHSRYMGDLYKPLIEKYLIGGDKKGTKLQYFLDKIECSKVFNSPSPSPLITKFTMDATNEGID